MLTTHHQNEQAQCKIFGTTFNPEAKRMGNKVLRQRLRGPAMADYYPRKFVGIRDLQREFGHDLQVYDEEDEERLEALSG